MIHSAMRYLVRAKLKSGVEEDLLEAVEDGTLGRGSIAFGEYERNMRQARLCEDGTVRWVEVCYCPRPLMEEIPYWETYFDLVKIIDAHDRRRCRDWIGEEPWACSSCDCTKRLEANMETWGDSFLTKLGEGMEVESPTKERPRKPSEVSITDHQIAPI